MHVAAFDLNLLTAFEALWTERHVTRAARRVGLTQSAMSHALARLRAQLDDPLFRPTPRGLEPSARAHALWPSIGEALALIRQAVEAPRPFTPATLRRTFTLSTSDYGDLALLPRLMARLGEEAPFVQLVVRPTVGTGSAELLSGAHDLLVGVDPPRGDGLRGEVLFADGFVCLLRKGHPAARRPLTLARFAALKHVLISPQGSGDTPVDAALRAHGLSRHIALRVPHFLSAPLVIAASDAIITMPSRVARAVKGAHGLVERMPPLAVPGFSVSMYWHVRNDDDPAHRWLRGVVRAIAER